MNLGDLTANAGIVWLILAVILGGAELVVPGVFLVFLAIAAGLTGIAMLVLPLPIVAQLASFAVWSGVTVAIGQRWYRDYPVPTSNPLLNDRGAQLIGQIVIVDEAITDGIGRVRVGDGVWSARGGDAPVGTRLRVAGIEHGTLIVEPLTPPR